VRTVSAAGPAITGATIGGVYWRYHDCRLIQA
jgi:hypothetical protein